jgi:tetratricopeptide (TPR) repeat protein
MNQSGEAGQSTDEGTNMKSGSCPIGVLFVEFVLVGVGVPAVLAQMSHNQQSGPVTSPTDSMQTELHDLTDVQTQGQGIDTRELADYKKFYQETAEPAKKIELGKAFLHKYPKSTLSEAVDAGLVMAYIERHDWPNVYSTADQALALKPDDVDVLTTVGWIIPHVYRPDDPNGDDLLSKAETYEKHAMEVLATMPKPARVTDSQFTQLKAQKSFQAHSALGLVYFRREDYDHSAKELQQTAENNPSPDPTDLYILGVDLENLKRSNEAADVFGRCAAIQSSLQDRCKESEDAMKKVASR